MEAAAADKETVKVIQNNIVILIPKKRNAGESQHFFLCEDKIINEFESHRCPNSKGIYRDLCMIRIR